MNPSRLVEMVGGFLNLSISQPTSTKRCMTQRRRTGRLEIFSNHLDFYRTLEVWVILKCDLATFFCTRNKKHKKTGWLVGWLVGCLVGWLGCYLIRGSGYFLKIFGLYRGYCSPLWEFLSTNQDFMASFQQQTE